MFIIWSQKKQWFEKKKKEEALLGWVGWRKLVLIHDQKGVNSCCGGFLLLLCLLLVGKRGGRETLVGWFLLCAPWVGVGNTPPPTKRKSSKKQPPPAYPPPCFSFPPTTNTHPGTPKPKAFSYPVGKTTKINQQSPLFFILEV